MCDKPCRRVPLMLPEEVRIRRSITILKPRRMQLSESRVVEAGGIHVSRQSKLERSVAHTHIFAECLIRAIFGA